MKWRLREGQGEALYEIGVRDCGRVRGLAPTEMKASLRTLRRMAARLGAACTLLGHRRLPDTRRALVEVLVRKVTSTFHFDQ
jgi:GTPase